MSEPLSPLPEPSCVGRGTVGGGPQELGGAQAAAGTACLFLALASMEEAGASLPGGLYPKPVQPRGGSGASRSRGGWVLGQTEPSAPVEGHKDLSPEHCAWTQGPSRSSSMAVPLCYPLPPLLCWAPEMEAAL